MPYTTYDSNGNVVAQGGGPSSGSFVLPFGHYWNSNGSANQYNSLVNPLYNQNGGTLGLANANWTAGSAGTITAISMFEAGPANGAHTVQILTNNNVIATIPVGTGGNGTPFQVACSVPFNKNDAITAQVTNTASGNSQVQMSLTIKLSS